MNKLFVIQLIVSFLVGGGVISLLSFIAEKSHKRIAGIILAFPTTVSLGFFFLGWTLSPEAVADVVPATLIPLGLSVLFAAECCQNTSANNERCVKLRTNFSIQ